MSSLGFSALTTRTVELSPHARLVEYLEGRDLIRARLFAGVLLLALVWTPVLLITGASGKVQLTALGLSAVLLWWPVFATLVLDFISAQTAYHFADCVERLSHNNSDHDSRNLCLLSFECIAP